MQTITGSGDQDIMVANTSRTFDLQAENKKDQIAWLAALQKAKPEIYVQPVAMKLSAKDKKARNYTEMGSPQLDLQGYL